MKRFTIIVLMLVYGLSSSGMSVTFHYCCGKFENITFTSDYKKPCLHGRQFSKQKCCDNKKIDLKLKAGQEKSIKQVNINSTQTVSITPVYNTILLSPNRKPVNESSAGPPIITSAVPLFIQYLVFRI